MLIRKLWRKLLDAAVLEDIAEGRLKSEKAPAAVTNAAIPEWFREADGGEIWDRQEVPPRVRVDTRRSAKGVLFDTCDHGFIDACSTETW